MLIRHVVALFLLASLSVSASEKGDARFEQWVDTKKFGALSAKEMSALKRQFKSRKIIADRIVSEASVDLNEIEALVEDYRINLLLKLHMDNFLAGAVKDSDVRDYFDKKTSEFQINKVRVSHIFLRPGVDESTGKKTKKITKEILERIHQGASFESEAIRYSHDKVSGLKGGALGWIPEGYLNKKFSSVVFSMKEGEISPVFKSSAGHHIVRIESAPKIDVVTFSSVREKIRNKLLRQAKRAELKRLKDKSGAT